MLDRGLVEIRPSRIGYAAFLTEADLAALRFRFCGLGSPATAVSGKNGEQFTVTPSDVHAIIAARLLGVPNDHDLRRAHSLSFWQPGPVIQPVVISSAPEGFGFAARSRLITLRMVLAIQLQP
jgi:hypothetical protein